MDCRDVQDRIAAWNEGWLGEAESAAVAAHVAGCSACQKAAALDRRLRTALDAVPEMAFRAPSWRQVAAAHSRPAPRRAPRWLLLPALGAAAASAALLWITLRHPIGGPGSGDTTVATADLIETSAPQAHLILGASDLGSDPNRAIVAYWSSTEKP